MSNLETPAMHIKTLTEMSNEDREKYLDGMRERLISQRDAYDKHLTALSQAKAHKLKLKIAKQVEMFKKEISRAETAVEKAVSRNSAIGQLLMQLEVEEVMSSDGTQKTEESNVPTLPTE